MLRPIDVRPFINNFAASMLTKLSQPRNMSKPHWKNESIEYLVQRLDEEVTELKEALAKGDFFAIRSECCDVAIFAAMIADNSK